MCLIRVNSEPPIYSRDKEDQKPCFMTLLLGNFFFTQRKHYIVQHNFGCGVSILGVQNYDSLGLGFVLYFLQTGWFMYKRLDLVQKPLECIPSF